MPNLHDTSRADLQEEFDEHALIEGYFDRDEDEPDDAYFESQMPELSDPEYSEDQLRIRSENIDMALDAAFERGDDEFNPGAGAEYARAQADSLYVHPKMRKAYLDGWDAAAADFIGVAG